MIENVVVRIMCGEELGTAFYIAPDLLLTACHTLVSYNEAGLNVVKDSYDGDLSFVVLNKREDFDLALLRVSGRSSAEYLKLYSCTLRIGEDVISFGYPDKASASGLRVKGSVNQKYNNAVGDFVFIAEGVDDAYDYEGMSGAPVLLNNKAVGMVIEQSGNNLISISIHKLYHLLIDQGISVEKEVSLASIPASIAENVGQSRPNIAVLDNLNERLNCSSGWLLLYGVPGSGKTTLSAAFTPYDGGIEVLGRFFFKVPNDSISRAIRCSESFFVDWLEAVYITTVGEEADKLSFESKRKEIPDWFASMGQKLSEEGKKGVIIIDGLDELSAENGNYVGDFLSLFPSAMPENISVVLSCIKKEILPPSIIEMIAEDDCIEVTPLSMVSCESYIEANSGEWVKPYSFIQAVAIKTEGHPLYMNYLCRDIAETFDENTDESDLNKWLDALPTIGGNIRAYYEAIWRKVDVNKELCQILAVLSQVRGAVTEAQLIEMLKGISPFEFVASVVGFRHLLKDRGCDTYEIYHSSFRLYIVEKLKPVISYANDLIADFCDVHYDNDYALDNYLHHVVNGTDVKKGLAMCNQEWADKCAINDVSPDLVMHDVKECLSFAVDEGLGGEVVRLMLLAQRIENRYDAIMVDNVDIIAELAFLLEKPDVAMKYLVRDNSLLVGLSTAIHYLQVFLEKGCVDQALLLSDAIDSAIRRDLRESMEAGFDPAILALKGFLIVEGVYAGLEDPSDLKRYFEMLVRLKEGTENGQSVDAIVDIISAYNMSREMRAGKKLTVDKFLQSNGLAWNAELIVLLVKALAFYEDKDSELNKIGYNDAYMDCLRGLETVLLNGSYEFDRHELKLLLRVLFDRSKQCILVRRLLQDYKPSPGNFSFRQTNGVDVDHDSLTRFYQELLYESYLDENNMVPKLNRDFYRTDSWEKYVEALIRRTAYVHGTLVRKKALGEDYSCLYSQLEEVLQFIDFSFGTRTQWKRSYLLPEELFPFLYEKIAELYRDFYYDKLSDLMSHLEGRMPDQLCLYREGYCAALIRISGVFRNGKQTRECALRLNGEAEEYVKYAVQNRGERCSYLLKICYGYALMGDKDNTEAVYREVLNSSMGPDWYKEAQLDLINVFRETDITLKGNEISSLAAVFEEASGEMTFQRYVQQEKNEFVATIAKSSSLADAVSYYKFETLPSTERIIRNAEEWKVDMPVPGKGYDLGANHLIEASAMCYLLDECKKVSPYIRYALSELFWDNPDKMHNDYRYARLHAGIIDEMQSREHLDDLLKRMAGYVAYIYSRDDKGSYLTELEKSDVCQECLDVLEKQIKICGYNWDRDKNHIGESKQSDSMTVDSSRKSSVKSLLESRRKEIVSPAGSYWFSLSEFLPSLVNNADFDKENLFGAIFGHYDVNVRPSQLQHDKFTWFVGYHEENDKDEQMIDFLIWFLIHPDREVSLRAENSLLWLCRYDDRVVGRLIKEIQSLEEIGLGTIASEVLLKITMTNPEITLRYMVNEDVQTNLEEVRNFSVSLNLYRIAMVLSEQCNYTVFLDKMKRIIPDTIPDRGDVMIDYDYMMFVEHKIEKLSNLRVTGAKDFAIPYVNAVKALQKDGEITRLHKADEYITRSFYLASIANSRYIRQIENVLNNVLYGKVDYKRAEKVYNAIND